ncbi:unnamed protein product [Brassica oleracea var. botrytis]|uniref:(rape) hypothetical protein n=1 Tax=Brassica napus TaxID=3708 RepID=A0A816L7N7_BRANA|nr:unnamed protein product [Brassica napus]
MIVPSMRDSLLQVGLSASINRYAFLLSNHILNLLNNEIIVFPVTGKDKNASRLYFYYSLSYEMTGDLVEIRG